MFIIVDEKVHNQQQEQVIAINLDSADRVSIRRKNDGLVILTLDQRHEQSWIHTIISNFKTEQDAIDCFGHMMDAYQQGIVAWHAPKPDRF